MLRKIFFFTLFIVGFLIVTYLADSQEQNRKSYPVICLDDSISDIIAHQIDHHKGTSYIDGKKEKYQIYSGKNLYGSGSRLKEYHPKTGDSIYKLPDSDTIFFINKKNIKRYYIMKSSSKCNYPPLFGGN